MGLDHDDDMLLGLVLVSGFALVELRGLFEANKAFKGRAHSGRRPEGAGRSSRTGGSEASAASGLNKGAAQGRQSKFS